MPMVPFYFGYDVVPHCVVNHHDFELDMTGNDVTPPAFNYPPMPRDFYHPWGWDGNQFDNHVVGSEVKKDKDKFVINLDVEHFAPEEIRVKTADGYIIIEGKHGEKRDHHGFISREFTRRYALPEGANPDLVESKLSSDGVLSVIVLGSTPEAKNERAVPIALTGPIRKEVHKQSSTTRANASEI